MEPQLDRIEAKLDRLFVKLDGELGQNGLITDVELLKAWQRDQIKAADSRNGKMWALIVAVIGAFGLGIWNTMKGSLK